jgi:ssDNA-binding Zn-finger/Zn-ribbon topoisomerase 1
MAKFIFELSMLIGLACLVVLYRFYRLSSERVCKDCGYKGAVKKTRKGSLLIEIILWFCFLIPGLIYTVWRFTNRVYFCPSCRSHKMLAIDSPLGRQLGQNPI